LGASNLLRRFPLASFFAVAYAWTWICWWLVAAAAAGHVALPVPGEALATVGQFGPFAAALAVAAFTQGRQGLGELLGRLVCWRARPVWLAVSLLLLPATMYGAIVLYARFHALDQPLSFRGTLGTLPAQFVYSLLLGGPLGEEPGWRAFALPRLQARYGPVGASFWLGLLWAGWHWPLWFIYSAPCPFPLYVAGAILMTILFTWLFNHTHGSVLYSLLFHASMTTASVRLPEAPAYQYWVACLLVVVLGILVCDRRLGLPGDTSSGAAVPTTNDLMR